MKFQRRSRLDIDVNMTPLIDVVFLLLIFFMVSTTFSKSSHLGINLPKAVLDEKKTTSKEQLQLVIDVNGTFKIDGKALENNHPESLKQALRDWVQKQEGAMENLSMTISADADTAHQYVVTAMDVAGQLGISKLSISTLPEESL